MTKKILILRANPQDTESLPLDEEVREINACLKRTKKQEQFDIDSWGAVRYGDFRKALLDFEPQIVHFSGHGEEDGLIMVGDIGVAAPVSSEVLAGLFELCAEHVECVILNACYSAPQAEAISKHIDYVIGNPGAINDVAAIKFSEGFYDALGAGKSFEEAFKFGRNAFVNEVPGVPESLHPILIGKKMGTAAEPAPLKPQEVADTLEIGLEHFRQQDFEKAVTTLQLVRNAEPDNRKAQLYYCISALSGKPLGSIPQPHMDEIDQTLNNVLQEGDQDVRRRARLVLGIIRYDYYQEKKYNCRGVESKIIYEELEEDRPGSEEKALLAHIAYSDIAKVYFNLY
ncbi:MAG: hypothetical protein GY950_00395 [bacterium]|nr:hypothetical protein [bacterium]